MRIFLHIRPNNAGMGAQPARLEHGHCRFHTEGPCDIARGQHDAAPAPADDHRFVRQRRVVAFFDGCIKGVAVDMRDGERVDLGVPQDAR
jgi:hypothetical protein